VNSRKVTRFYDLTGFLSKKSKETKADCWQIHEKPIGSTIEIGQFA
jgi:hypothetical protein